MFTNTAHLYDLIYSFKDYAAESAGIAAFLRENGASEGGAVLDVGCGTGRHVEGLGRAGFAVNGLDLDAGLLDVARERNPGVAFHQADMAEFELGRTYDAVICLFGSIGYVLTVTRLDQTVRTFARHLKPGGVLLIEPWLTPETFTPGHVHMLVVDQPDLKLTRMSVSRVEPGPENPISPLDFHYQMATPEGVTRFEEHHRLGLFTDAQYRSALQAAVLTPSHVADAPTTRGLYVARANPD